MIEVGQEFKSYRQLCQYLNEDIKGGDAKKAQLKRWHSQFEYHKEGNRIIIDAVKDSATPIIKGCSNHPNMDIYLPYIYSCLSDYLGEPLSTTKIICDVLQIFNKETLVSVWKRDPEFYKTHEFPVLEKQKFRNWLVSAREYVMLTFERTLNQLQRSGLIDYEMGYGFYSKPERIKYTAYAYGCRDTVNKIEAYVCNEINRKHGLSSQISDKRLLFIINKSKQLQKEYTQGVISRILADKPLMTTLQSDIDEQFYGIDFGSKEYPIHSYWKIWRINELEQTNISGDKQDYLNLIVQKSTKSSEEWRKLSFLQYV